MMSSQELRRSLLSSIGLCFGYGMTIRYRCRRTVTTANVEVTNLSVDCGGVTTLDTVLSVDATRCSILWAYSAPTVAIISRPTRTWHVLIGTFDLGGVRRLIVTVRQIMSSQLAF